LQGYKPTQPDKTTSKDTSKTINDKQEVKVKKSYQDVNEAHPKSGHMSEKNLQLTARRDNFVLAGRYNLVQHVYYIRQLRDQSRRQTLMKANYPGERIHMDVAGPFPNTLGGHRYWVMFKDQYSGMAWNVFIPSKTKHL
jgi:hypothetical protein